MLATWADVLAWARQFGLLDREVAKGDAAQVHSLRDAFRRILEEEADESDLAMISEALAIAPASRLRRNGSHFALSSSQVRNSGELIGALAQLIVDFLTSPDLHRARQCASDKCVLWFIDRTRNRSRHWCRMDRCGARAKSAAYYARNKAKGPADRSAGPSDNSN